MELVELSFGHELFSMVMFWQFRSSIVLLVFLIRWIVKTVMQTFLQRDTNVYFSLAGLKTTSVVHQSLYDTKIFKHIFLSMLQN